MSTNSELGIWKYTETCNLKGYTVIVPSVAVGNVSQLTCDLLISSLEMKKIASIYTTAIIPILGYDPYSSRSNLLSSSCELYVSKPRKLAVIQFRAPLVSKFAKEFLNYIVNDFVENEIKELIILTSSFAHERKHVMTSPFRYIVNDLYDCKEKLAKLHWIEHEKQNDTLTIFGGGFAALLFNISKNLLPCLLLYKYCSEGDNVPDAYEMIEYLSKAVVLSEAKDIMSQLVQPVSWNLLFGRPAPVEIY